MVIHTGTYIQSDVLAVAELARRFTETYTFICDVRLAFPICGLNCLRVIAEITNLLFIASLIWPRQLIGNTVKNIGRTRGALRQRAFFEPRFPAPAATQTL